MTRCKLTFHEAGSCVHPQHVVLRDWKFSKLRFPAMFAVLEHPTRGVVLYDTGYSEHFCQETERWPGRLYGIVTPVELPPQASALAHLARRGIGADDVRAIICSHFHADHVSALADFPKARFLCLPDAWRAVCGLRGLRGVLKGFLPGLIPHDFESRFTPLDPSATRPLPSECAPFTEGLDLFGDESVYGVPLPGHAAGQLGLFVPGDERSTLLVADACWTSRSYREQIMPSQVTRLLFDDYGVYGHTLARLSELAERSPQIQIVPSHCDEVLSRLVT